MKLVVTHEILQRAIIVGAASIAFAHSGPSDSLEPSGEDESIARYIFESARLMEMHLIDHVPLANCDSLSWRSKHPELF